MIPIPAAFSGSYAEARTKFLEGAASLGLAHPLPSASDERARRRDPGHGRGA
jgi:hypothetical protein